MITGGSNEYQVNNENFPICDASVSSKSTKKNGNHDTKKKVSVNSSISYSQNSSLKSDNVTFHSTIIKHLTCYIHYKIKLEWFTSSFFSLCNLWSCKTTKSRCNSSSLYKLALACSWDVSAWYKLTRP